MTNSYTNVRPEIYQFNLGKFRITNILDGYFHREDMHPFTATNASAPEIEKIAKQHFLPLAMFRHHVPLRKSVASGWPMFWANAKTTKSAKKLLLRIRRG